MLEAITACCVVAWFFGAVLGAVILYESRLFPDRGVVVPPWTTRQHARAFLRAMAWPVIVAVRLIKNQ